MPRPRKILNVVLPFSVELDGCTVSILEVVPYVNFFGETRYLVSVRVRCGNRVSPNFFLDITSNEELVAKLKIELAKFKILELAY